MRIVGTRTNKLGVIRQGTIFLILFLVDLMQNTGIGLLLERVSDGLEVIGIVPDTPAHHGGLVLSKARNQTFIEWERDKLTGVDTFQVGDVITCVDDQTVANAHDQWPKLLAGPQVRV